MSDLERLIRQIVRSELATAKPANDTAEHLTVAQYAQRLAVSERTVRDAIRESRLVHERIGRAIRIRPDAKIQPRTDGATAQARLVLLGGKR